MKELSNALPDDDIDAQSETTGEDEEPWVWTPPTEEDILLYLQERAQNFPNSTIRRGSDNQPVTSLVNAQLDSSFMR